MLRDDFDLSDVHSAFENDARLRGVMAMLALPEVWHRGRARRRVVEVEVTRDHWEVVDGVSVDFEANVVTFYAGMNGHSREWMFLCGERMPDWRVDHAPREIFYLAESPR